ncbi:hypothetical protein [Actinoplanes siamensis]|uniref:Uncharacterized protein n=1 Tax=Actinoplanes siamensis TaxID=1223317 RepID=A0A919NCI8_9ACTN|nr:hypothetical protein [Actinoplanes siamensis]GIF08606.1 hypothetical protein Asi03nite_61440 [Actinoplanes siamensis]
MDHRVQSTKHEVSPGVVLKVSVMGGYSVEREGDYIGWIHAGVGDRWSAYVRRPGTSGDLLGRYAQDEAVKAIVTAWDAGVALPNGCRA